MIGCLWWQGAENRNGEPYVIYQVALTVRAIGFGAMAKC